MAAEDADHFAETGKGQIAASRNLGTDPSHKMIPKQHMLDDGKNFFGNVLRIVGLIELYVALTSFCLVVAMVVVQIGLRFFFHYSIWWAQEVSQLLMLFAYFLGISYLYKLRYDVIVDFLVRRLSWRTQLVLFVVAQLLTLALCLTLAVNMIELVPQQSRMRSYILGIPKVYSSFPLLIGSISMSITAVYYLVRVVVLARRYGPGVPLGKLEERADPFIDRNENEVVSL